MRQTAIISVTAILIVISVHQYLLFHAEIDRAEAILEQYEIDERRPEYADLVELSHGLGRSAEFVANAALSDALVPIRLAGADPETRELWIRALRNLDDELLDTRALILDAVEVRPGWARHLSLAGQIEYVLARQGEETTFDRWSRPLWLGARSEGGTRIAWRVLGGAYLEMWPLLSDEEKQNVPEVLTVAFHDPQFVRQALPFAYQYMGGDALAHLPDEPATLSAAMRLMPAALGPDESWLLYERWLAAEWQAREDDLDSIREALRLGDDDRAEAEAQQWLGAHPFTEFDSPEGLEQLSEVVNAVTAGRPEQWGRGQQTRLVGFLIDPWRREHVEMDGVWRIAERIRGVPDPLVARARLAAGRVSSAQRLAESSGTAGSLEWTDFYVDLARHHIAAQQLDAAADVLGRISIAARDQCEVLIVRKALAEVVGNTSLASLLETDLRIVSLRGLETRTRGGRAVLPACITPGDRALVDVVVKSDEPVIAELGWDTGRSQSLLVHGETSLQLPAREGSHLLMLTTPLDRDASVTLGLP